MQLVHFVFGVNFWEIVTIMNTFFESAILRFFFWFILMKISQSFLSSKDGSKFLWLLWFPAVFQPRANISVPSVWSLATSWNKHVYHRWYSKCTMGLKPIQSCTLIFIFTRFQNILSFSKDFVVGIEWKSS